MQDATGEHRDSPETEARVARLDTLLEERVRPRLPALAAAQQRFCLLAAGAVAAAIVTLIVAASIGDPIILFVNALFAILLFVGGGVLAVRFFGNEVRSVVTPVVCEAIGGIRHDVDSRDDDVDRLRQARLVTSYNRREIDDAFSGEHRGVAFVMMELRLLMRTTVRSTGRRGGGTNTHTHVVFKGLMFMIRAPRVIQARILMRGRRRMTGTSWRPRERELEGMQRVTVPDAALSERLALWADDPEIALQVVTPPFASVMATLAATAGRRGLDAAFSGDRFLLILPRRGNLFAVGSLFRPVRDLHGEAHRLMDEILVIHRLIDMLIGQGESAAEPTATAPA